MSDGIRRRRPGTTEAPRAQEAQGSKFDIGAARAHESSPELIAECDRCYRPALLSAGPADHWQRSANGRRLGSAPLTANVIKNGPDRGRTTAKRSSALPYRSLKNAMARLPDSSRLPPPALGYQEPSTKRPPSRLTFTETAQGPGCSPSASV